MIALFKKGRTHIVNDLDCTIVRVETIEQMNALLAEGGHFHTVEELYGSGEEKPKRGRKAKSAEDAADVVELAESEPVASADENQDSAD